MVNLLCYIGLYDRQAFGIERVIVPGPAVQLVSMDRFDVCRRCHCSLSARKGYVADIVEIKKPGC